ncbi:hypothetical protein ACPOM7_14415 [Peribacillus castrilensis]|uniref:hypothetical protein n=1 Tax=Peribacillus TaxID=2675229 RepID=UPI0009316100|nr:MULTISPECIES: hypothetical protein [Peribacillus]MCP1151300.1 hypothetical protein [Peribacillus frigoritolerans]MCT1388960.1 hypothetical protein [Peribacillus frigoritolerans]NCT35521.1 hypothetical protein [Peribacillus frigoritolerans]
MKKMVMSGGYTQTTRATKTGEKIYREESEALQDFIERIRGDKAMRMYSKTRHIRIRNAL